MSTIQTYPVIPLRETVLFPGTPTLVRAGRPGTLEAIREAMKTDEQLVFVVAQRDNDETFELEQLHSFGTIAHIDQLQRQPRGLQLILEGKQRGAVVKFEQRENHIAAVVREVEEIPPQDPRDPVYLGLHKELRERAIEAGELAGLPEDFVRGLVSDIESPGQLTDAVANSLDIKSSTKQTLLEELSIEQRMRQVLVHLQKQIAVLDVQKEIRSKVQKKLENRQREAVLREQLAAIKKELGDGSSGDDLDELKKTLQELELPEEARKEVDRQLKRLGRSMGESVEAQVIRTYLETIAELPWNKSTEDKTDLAFAEQVLDEDHYGLEDVKDRILEFLAVRHLQRAREQEQDDQIESKEERSRSPILLFVGPPGVGKTSVAKSIARSLGREYVRIALGGVRDEADIRGHRRTYVGAMPGRIIQGLRQAGSRNPVILLDEVDKLSASYQGNPSSALLEVLDPAQNHTFVDHYLGVPFDLSEALFIATSNFIERIPGPLRDRMEIVEFRGYTEEEKSQIATRYIIPRQLREKAIEQDQFVLNDQGLAEVITCYTREAGVRQLERVIGKLARKIARKVAINKESIPKLDHPSIRKLLGRPKIRPEQASLVDQVGVATGMYYTPMGGDIMFVEVTRMAGKGKLVLTGQLGDVMKESAQAAWSYARSHAKDLNIDPEWLESDLHIHVPAGAVPKDGPSAGVTMATALISVLTNTPVRRDLAMTGEITLTGRVLPVGGIKEKVLGAVRAGLTKILLPRDNAGDLEDLPEHVRGRLEIILAEDLGVVFDTALRTSKQHLDAPESLERSR